MHAKWSYNLSLLVVGRVNVVRSMQVNEPPKCELLLQVRKIQNYR